MKGLSKILIWYAIISYWVIFGIIPLNAFGQSDTLISYYLIEHLSSDSLWGRSAFKNGKQKSLSIILDFIEKHAKYPYLVERVTHDTINLGHIEKAEITHNNSKIIEILQEFVPHAGSPSFVGEVNVIRAEDLNQNLMSSAFFVCTTQESFSIQRENLAQWLYKGMQGLILEQDPLFYQPQIEFLPFPILFVKPNQLKTGDALKIELILKQLSYPIENVIINDTSVICSEPKITLMAHYDHLGTIEDSLIFNGANDNASGVALATQLFLRFLNQGKRIQLVLTDAEEIGLLGSKYLIESNALFPIQYLINLDMTASGDSSFGVVGIDTTSNAFLILKQIAESKHARLKPRPNAPNSDHYWFLSSGTNGFYFYSNNGKQPYHSTEDDFISLNYSIYKYAYTILNFFLEKAFLSKD